MNKNIDLPDNVRLPPHSIEAEQSVLGGVMLDPEYWDRLAEILVEQDFYRQQHQIIFSAIRQLVEGGQELDIITLSERLEGIDEDNVSGGIAYLTELAKITPSAANILAYAEIVQERAVLRQLIGAANDVIDATFNRGAKKPDELIDFAESTIFRVAESRDHRESGPQGIKPLLQKALSKIEVIAEARGGITGLSTGFTDLDKLTTGMQPADLVIVAARPSMGKTTFAMNMVEHAAVNADKPALVFSMEMPAEALMMRSLASLGRVDSSHMRTGELDNQDWAQLTSAFNLLNEQGKLYIDDTPSLTPSEVRSRARRLYREHGGLSMIMIDYLQLMKVPALSDNRTLEIAEISRSLKALAKELGIPVVALSQLNRSLESRADRRPVMSDIRESGSIEQDADLIMFIYRDEVYNPETEAKGTAEIIIGKQRNGPIGTVRLTFIGKYTRFENYAVSEEY
ncbi:MAG: replicative DNA helicase [Pseudomonadota bacterium]